jgi:hypothetical protein
MLEQPPFAFQLNLLVLILLVLLFLTSHQAMLHRSIYQPCTRLPFSLTWSSTYEQSIFFLKNRPYFGMCRTSGQIPCEGGL